jgi:ribose transport system permease protein
VRNTVALSLARARVGAFYQGDAFQRLLAFSALIMMIVYFTVASPYFFSFENFVNIIVSACVVGVLALGVTFVIVTGGIDLSIGTVMTISAVMTGVATTWWHLPVALGILVGIGTGGLFGLINGILIARFKLPPFIATLGTLNIARGMALVITHGTPIYFNNNPELTGTVMGSAVGNFIPAYPIPNIALILFGAALLAGFLLSKTALGRYTYALGSNEEAVRLSGVSVAIWKIAVYTLCGLFVGLGGVLIAARIGSAQPAVGFGYELEAISAVVIGGTSLSGGEGTILGTIIGAFVLKTLLNGLQIMSISNDWQITITGVVVIAAVYLDIVRRRQSA